MTPSLLLIRHGNTFEPGETPRRVGAKTDLPLTEEGRRQARTLAAMISRDYMPVGAIITGPLKRTIEVAKTISGEISNTFTADERLSEINYGLWENKTDDEIKTSYGPEALEAWEQHGLWPENGLWAPSREKVFKNLANILSEQRKMLDEQPSHHRILVTSNGILRLVHSIITGTEPSPKGKVKTGHFCVLIPRESGWTILKWNEKPL